MSSTSVSIERYAELRAEMEAGHLRDDVLKRAGMAIEQWTVVQREWLGRMGAELERGKFELTNRYTERFLARQQALQTNAQRDVAQLHEAAAPMPVTPPVVASSLSSPTVVATASMPAVIAPSVPSSNAQPLDATADLNSGMQIAALARQILPFNSNMPAASSVATPKAPRIEEAPAPIASRSPVRPGVHIGPNPRNETMSLPAVTDIESLTASALPFEQSVRPGSRSEVFQEKPLPVVPKTPADLGTTGDISAFVPRTQATPFEKSGLDKPAAKMNPGVRAPEPPENPALTLEQYASLCVDYAAAPNRAAEIAQRYGLSRDQWIRVDSYWRGKMMSDPALRKAWEKACVTYQEWLAKR